MAENENTTEILRRLVALVAENGLSELTVEEDGLVVNIKAFADPMPAPASLTAIIPQPHLLPPSQTPPYSQTVVTGSPASTPAGATAAPPAGRIAMESPMVGVFYRSPAPGDPPFVNVGDTVRVGQTIGLIEAMKVYSEVPSEVAGRIVEIPVENAKLVQQGQPLLFVEPV